ncbi:unnamed protein product, partial [Urochloa humidicola]
IGAHKIHKSKQKHTKSVRESQEVCSRRCGRTGGHSSGSADGGNSDDHGPLDAG